MFVWTDYLVLAERLAARDADEAALRTAISRAYYAAYHRASTYVRANILVPPRSVSRTNGYGMRSLRRTIHGTPKLPSEVIS